MVGLLSLMTRERSDYTRTFPLLSETEVQNADSPLRDTFIDLAAFDSWFSDYRTRLAQEAQSDEQRQRSVKAANPKYILRNYLVQRAIEAIEQDDVGPLKQLHQTFSCLYDEQSE
ncbi:MAG: protein adenylyltransferase SelO family protein [Candidatus Malihini olakiniferum]